MSAANQIIQTIKERGPVSFRDFMDMALYQPECGYYASDINNIGKYGDYYTSPVLTSLFGAVIGKQLEEMWKFSGAGPFTIVEYGAGDGKLCRDILEYLQQNKKLFSQLKYLIIEKGNKCEMLEGYLGVVSIQKCIKPFSGFTGCIISNELIDNFPVHRIIMQDELMEIYVDYRDGFAEYLFPAGQELKDYFNKWNIILPEGYQAEINLDAQKWMMDNASALGTGYFITIDYGYAVDDLYSTKRNNGTLTCYHGHQGSTDPYQEIGKKDITAHVNFTALMDWGTDCGLDVCGLVSQADFLLSLGIKTLFIDKYSKTGNIAEAAMLQSRLNHMLLLEMGYAFKVLVQKKGNVPATLTGLKK